MQENNNQNPEVELDENHLIQIRKEKLRELQEQGKNPFEITKYDRTNSAGEIKAYYEAFEQKDVKVAGRIIAKRIMGKASFCTIQDSDEKIQSYVSINELGEEAYKEFKTYDIGDIIGISGFVFKTKTEEISVHAKEVILLTKSLRPLPEKFHGLKDIDLRYRQRYVDLIVNPEVKNTFVLRSKIIKEVKTYLDNKGDLTPKDLLGRNILFAGRNEAMGSIANGLALSGFRPFVSTHMNMATKVMASIKMSALMNLPVTYIFTHDTILIGQDGVTHQPIEQLAMLRTIPNLAVYRPCDYKELIGSWNLILKNNRPAALVISKYPTESYKYTSIEETELGGYVISEVKNRLDLILIASGSEVTLAMKIKQELLKNFIETRIVSMPNINDFFKQSKEYQNQVLPKGYKRMVLELSNDPTVYRLVKNEEDVININSFGKSGTKEEILQEFELDLSSIIIKIKNNL